MTVFHLELKFLLKNYQNLINSQEGVTKHPHKSPCYLTKDLLHLPRTPRVTRSFIKTACDCHSLLNEQKNVELSHKKLIKRDKIENDMTRKKYGG